MVMMMVVMVVMVMMILVGKHLVKHRAKTQTVINLSSAEAQLYAAVKASSEEFGFPFLVPD